MGVCAAPRQMAADPMKGRAKTRTSDTEVPQDFPEVSSSNMDRNGTTPHE